MNLCPRCGASGDESCVTPSGNTAKRRHKGRSEVCQPVYATERSEHATFGPEVAAEATALGWEPMKWQTDAWNVLLEYEPAQVGLGHLFIRDQGAVTVPRQQGKSVGGLAVASWWAKKWPKQRIAWVSQERNLSVAQLAELADRLLETGVPIKFLQSAGKEHILFPNKSRIQVTSATEKAGHGASWDLVLADETWALKYQVLQSLVPAQTARPSSLMVLMSTMGDEDSSVLNDLVKRGRDTDPTLTYIEYSAPDGVDVFDEQNWPLWMPALTQSQHVTAKKIRSGAAMFASEPLEFIRAYGNRMTRSEQSVFPKDWVERATARPLPSHDGYVTVAVDVSRGPDGVAIAVAWTHDGHVYADIVEYQPGRSTGWVNPRVNQLVQRWPVSTIGLSYGPAVIVKQELTSLGVDLGVPVRDLNTSESVAASMRVFDLVRDDRLHVGNVGPLKEAMIAARQKVTMDRWMFDRRNVVDQSPLWAVAVAVELAWSESYEPVAAIY